MEGCPYTPLAGPPRLRGFPEETVEYALGELFS
jgi:hypothetical protein